jgi:hypothetical protein
MEFNQNYITEQIKSHIEVFNEDIVAKERELSNLNNAVLALDNIHRTLKDANFQNDMASVCERIGKEKTIKEKELEEFRKSIRIEFNIEQLITKDPIHNETINSEDSDWVEKTDSRHLVEDLQKIREWEERRHR